MGRYQISTRHGKRVEVNGGNWLVALGLGLDALGVVADIDRLACEVLLGGTVIVRDVRAGEHFVVQSLADGLDEPTLHIEDDSDEDLLFGEEESDEDALIAEEDSDEDDELALFSVDAASGRGSNVHVSLMGEEDIALPEDEPEEGDPRFEALCTRIDESITTFDAWKLALEGACEVIGAESGAALCREEDGALRFLFAVGPRAHDVLGRRLPPGQGIAGFCIQRDVGLLISDPGRDPRFFATMDQTTGYKTSAVLAVPVGTGDEMLGCLELLNAPGGFRQDQLEQLSSLAIGLAERLVSD